MAALRQKRSVLPDNRKLRQRCVFSIRAQQKSCNPKACSSRREHCWRRHASFSPGTHRQHAQYEKDARNFRMKAPQLVAELLGVGQNSGQRILDSCAAPGGKTAILLSNNAQASVVACDISAVRLKAMRQRLARPEWRERIEFHVADASRLPEMGLFDRILCDAPCSGTGTLARNPEIRHRLQPEDLQRQAARQRSILASLLRRLAPGGRLLYATCSLEPEEMKMSCAACLLWMLMRVPPASCSIYAQNCRIGWSAEF